MKPVSAEMADDDRKLVRWNPGPNERLQAAVLAYDPLADGAPRLVAKGHGDVAARMIEIARANGLVVHQDPALLDFLMRVDLEEQIPPALYIAVAAVLTLVWQAEQTAARGDAPASATGS
jgi:flagellar biosynthesis protein